MFIENLIGSKTKVKVLRVLSEIRTAYSLNDLEAETGLSLSIIHKSTEELVDEGILIKIKGRRKQRLYKFNANSPFAHPIFEIFKNEKTKQRKEVIFLHTWSILEETISKIKDKSDLIILFGSQARGDATLDSDIDLLVIPKSDSNHKILDLIKDRNKINPVFLDLKTFKSDIKNNTIFYKNIKKDSVILYLDHKIEKEIEIFLEDIQYKSTIIDDVN